MGDIWKSIMPKNRYAEQNLAQTGLIPQFLEAALSPWAVNQGTWVTPIKEMSQIQLQI